MIGCLFGFMRRRISGKEQKYGENINCGGEAAAGADIAKVVGAGSNITAIWKGNDMW